MSKQRRCARGCLDPDNPSMRAFLPCKHTKSGREAAKDLPTESSSPPLSTPTSPDHSALQAQPRSPANSRSITPVPQAGAAVSTPSTPSANRLQSALPSSLSPPPPAPGMPGIASASSWPREMPAFMRNRLNDAAQVAESTGAAEAPIAGDEFATGLPAGNIPSEASIEGNQESQHGGTLGIRSMRQDSEPSDALIAALAILREEDGENAATAAQRTTDAPPESSTEVRAGKKRSYTAQRPEPHLSEADQRTIWLNLPNAHKYANQHFTYVKDAEERSRVASRGTWRLVEQAAKLSKRTEMAVVVGLAHLDNGKHNIKSYVYISPNLCDPARPTLRTMAEDIDQQFQVATHKYREAAREDVIQETQARKELVAERVAHKAESDRLKAELEAAKKELLALRARADGSTGGQGEGGQDELTGMSENDGQTNADTQQS
ncbi:hypothetical protein A4X13_0g8013 [Tilletia indica]|uniref:Uncharacterized protein n=1 Tax=Tilletia indica TaxID=43049 RepID=A0A177TNB7_9BASI|nr:hypothetical protein A4X13_0g8013 [Tilletia indica]